MNEETNLINVSDILPYDFVRENEVIASHSEEGCLLYTSDAADE